MAFTFKLEHSDGTPADPPTLRSAVPNCQIGDTIPLGPRARRDALADHGTHVATNRSTRSVP
jgi:hypothetical protein